MSKQVVAVRCFAEENAGQWEAHCVDLGLTVRGESLELVKAKLDDLIHQHIDRKVAMRRTPARQNTQAHDRTGASLRSPIALRLRYWGLYLAGRLGFREDALRNAPHRLAEPRYRPQMATRSVR